MNPHELAERRLTLSAEYARLSEKMGFILSERPLEWLQLRKTAKSDKEADRQYEASPAGKEEVVLRYKLKGMEKEISGIKTYLEVLQGESRNNY